MSQYIYTLFEVIKNYCVYISLYECIQITQYLLDYNPLQNSCETQLYVINKKKLKKFLPFLGQTQPYPFSCHKGQ